MTDHGWAAPLRVWAADNPGDVALVVDELVMTVSELVALIDEQSEWCDLTSSPGDRIAIASDSRPEAVAALYSIPDAGRVLVPLNIRHSPGELRSQLDRVGAAAVLGIPELLGPLAACADGHDRHVINPNFPSVATPSGTVTFTAIEWLHDDPRGRSACVAGAAWVIFTSGTTGPPKGVLLTASSLRAAVATTAMGRPLADDDVYLYPFPLYHVAAYNVLHAHFRRRPVILPSRFDARAILRLANKYQVTSMSLAPTMLRMLLNEIVDNPDVSLASVRTVNYGAAAMAQSLLREANQTLGCDFAQGYGMTELSGNAVFLSPEDHRRGLAGEPRLLTAAGRAGPGVELRLVDDQGHSVPRGSQGEVAVRAPQVCAGYLDDPATTAATIKDGWLHTGDLGVIDPDELLYIVDRAKDIVVTGGENVASREVEDVLLSHRLIAQVAVVGLPDDHWGEAVTAVIVPTVRSESDLLADPEALIDELRSYVGRYLAGYKKPRRVAIVDSLPVNAGGKVDKRKLRQQIS